MNERKLPRMRLVVEVRAVEVRRGMFGGDETLAPDRLWAQEFVVVPQGDVDGMDFDDMADRVLAKGTAMAMDSFRDTEGD